MNAHYPDTEMCLVTVNEYNYLRDKCKDNRKFLKKAKKMLKK